MELMQHHIDKFTPDGKFIMSWGSLGKGNGQLYFPTDVFVDHLVGNVWVVDSGNDRIQEFTQDGKFINKLGPLGIATGGHLHNSVDFDLGLTGKGYLVDRDNSRIQVLSVSPTTQH
jgi:tripartite motif-containing protein 71